MRASASGVGAMRHSELFLVAIPVAGIALLLIGMLSLPDDERDLSMVQRLNHPCKAASNSCASGSRASAATAPSSASGRRRRSTMLARERERVNNRVALIKIESKVLLCESTTKERKKVSKKDHRHSDS